MVGCSVAELEKHDARSADDLAEGIVALSPPMARVLQHARKIAPLKGHVLLTGETGTGKTRLGELIHNLSGRRHGPFIKRGCGELVDEILGSELFGHRKGAFTSALTDRRGILAAADKGTLLLDDIDTLSLPAQARLLRFLDDGVVTRLGEDDTGQKTDVRIIATTNRDLEARVRDGAFKEDLLFRLRGWRLVVPPLRDRPEDVAELARRFLDEYQSSQTELKEASLFFDKDALDFLGALPWRGNIRELKQVVENVAAFGEPRKGRITQDVIARVLFQPGSTPCDNPASLSPDMGSDARIHRALTLTNWDIAKAARIAGCSRTTVYARMKARGWRKP